MCAGVEVSETETGEEGEGRARCSSCSCKQSPWRVRMPSFLLPPSLTLIERALPVFSVPWADAGEGLRVVLSLCCKGEKMGARECDGGEVPPSPTQTYNQQRKQRTEKQKERRARRSCIDAALPPLYCARRSSFASRFTFFYHCAENAAALSLRSWTPRCFLHQT